MQLVREADVGTHVPHALAGIGRARARRAFKGAIGEPVPYRCLSRADLVRTDEIGADLAASGCKELWMGAESGSDVVLQAMDKDGSVDEIRTATAILRRHHIKVGFFLQLGYPGEGLPEVLQTVDMVKELRPDDIGVSVTYPLPGTVFHERVAPSMTAQKYWDGSMENRPLYETTFDRAVLPASDCAASKKRYCFMRFISIMFR